MAKSKYREPEKLEAPILIISRESAAEKITAQVKKGKELREIQFANENQIDGAWNEYSKWDSYNIELLKRSFSNSSISDEYSYVGGSIGYINPSFHQRVQSYRDAVVSKVTRLEAVLGKLDLIPETPNLANERSKNANKDFGSDVFIVHGRDEAAKESVARFIEKLGLNAIILHEKPNAGKTLIEKFIHNSNVGFSVVLMTPDDVGASESEKNNLEPRARQNVIFELGYFVGSLGRERVCALYKPGVVPPSDWDGVAYVPMDNAGAWKILLAKEIKQIGIDIDLNEAI